MVVVVVQLVERSLLTPEICDLNLTSAKSYQQNFIYQLNNREDENKEKEARNGPLKKILNCLGRFLIWWFN